MTTDFAYINVRDRVIRVLPPYEGLEATVAEKRPSVPGVTRSIKVELSREDRVKWKGQIQDIHERFQKEWTSVVGWERVPKK